MASGKKSLLQSVLVVLLVIAAFVVGSMWTELRMLKGEGGLGVLGDKVKKEETADENGAGQAAGLSDELWQELTKEPAAVKGGEAKVTMVEFTDYQCPFCKRYVDQTAGQLMKDYVDSGKVQYIVRDLPLPIHQNAHLAAEAARCAGEQDKYWEYHDSLFDNQAEWSNGEAAILFKGYAGDLGLNQAEFNSCLDEGTFEAAVDEELVLARKVGATGTPTFFINGQKLVGAQPISAFTGILDKLLAE